MATKRRPPRRNAGSYSVAMSMLTFYMNRAGKKLTAEQRDRLEGVKDELRRRAAHMH